MRGGSRPHHKGLNTDQGRKVEYVEPFSFFFFNYMKFEEEEGDKEVWWSARQGTLEFEILVMDHFQLLVSSNN